MNDLETLQGLEKLEKLIHDGIERAEALVQKASQIHEMKQLLQTLQEHRDHLAQTTAQTTKLEAQTQTLEEAIEVAQDNLQTIDNNYTFFIDQTDAIEKKIQNILIQTTDIVTDIDHYRKFKETVIQELYRLEHQLKEEQLHREDTQRYLEKLQIELENVAHIQTKVTTLVQDSQDEQLQHIDKLGDHLSTQLHQIQKLESKLETLIQKTVDGPLTRIEPLFEDLVGLQTNLTTMEATLQDQFEQRYQQLTRRYQILGGITAIAAAGLALLGQWYLDQRHPQPASAASVNTVWVSPLLPQLGQSQKALPHLSPTAIEKN